MSNFFCCLFSFTCFFLLFVLFVFSSFMVNFLVFKFLGCFCLGFAFSCVKIPEVLTFRSFFGVGFFFHFVCCFVFIEVCPLFDLLFSVL